jgi:uncharacterized protein (TIGR02646 family)
MTPTQRGPAPALLAEHGAQIGDEYAERRRADPSFRFQWPRRDGESVYEVAHAALHSMTAKHCSYCDGHAPSDTGRDEIDHFRPKAIPAFHALVCTWDNLFLACTQCNQEKRDQWDERLLRPDDPDYAFERYFEYDAATGELRPSLAASATDRERAAITIAILRLNRPPALEARKHWVRYMRTLTADDGDDDNLAYRFLRPLCPPRPG